MVITKLTGGLGNQMFQYAAGLSLAHLLKTTLKIDRSVYWTYKLWPYSLDCFCLSPNFAAAKETAIFTKIIRSPSARKANLLHSFLGKFTKKYCFQEKFFHFDPDFFSLNPEYDYYLSGYWSSEKYFKPIEKILRKDFAIKSPLEGKNLQLARQIKQTTAVSIHVRRGDYISDKEANKFHGTCDLSYYRRCAAHLITKIKSPTFYVFSDDLAWSKKNFQFIKHPIVFVDHNQDKNYEDLRLMTLCQYNIIANSTFSWWGAWLNNNKQKQVFAPKKWFKDKSLNTKDLLPKSWNKI